MHAEDRPYIGQDRHLNCQRADPNAPTDKELQMERSLEEAQWEADREEAEEKKREEEVAKAKRKAEAEKRKKEAEEAAWEKCEKAAAAARVAKSEARARAEVPKGMRIVAGGSDWDAGSDIEIVGVRDAVGGRHVYHFFLFLLIYSDAARTSPRCREVPCLCQTGGRLCSARTQCDMQHVSQMAREVRPICGPDAGSKTEDCFRLG